MQSFWSRMYGHLYGATATVFASFGRPEMLLTHAVRRARRHSIAEFPDGMYGRVVGEAMPHGEALRAPISGAECVFYILRVVNPWAADPKTGAPVVVAREVSASPFFLDDGTGRALIDPAGAMGFLAAPSAAAPCDQVPMPIIWLLREHRVTAHSHYYYSEFIVPPKKIISVMGGGTREPDPLAAPKPEYRGPAVMRLRIAQTPPYSLMISDSADTFR